MEDDLQKFENGRRPQFFLWKTTLIFVLPKLFQNGGQPQKIMQPKIIKIKTMVVAPLRVT